VAPIQRNVSRVGGFQVCRNLVAIARLECVQHQRIAMTFALMRRVHAHQGQTPMRFASAPSITRKRRRSSAAMASKPATASAAPDPIGDAQCDLWRGPQGFLGGEDLRLPRPRTASAGMTPIAAGRRSRWGRRGRASLGSLGLKKCVGAGWAAAATTSARVLEIKKLVRAVDGCCETSRAPRPQGPDARLWKPAMLSCCSEQPEQPPLVPRSGLTKVCCRASSPTRTELD
jgi:hypothetical protein